MPTTWRDRMETAMPYFLAWLLGVPLTVLVLLYFFMGT
jgi:hypothetical protein